MSRYDIQKIRNDNRRDYLKPHQRLHRVEGINRGNTRAHERAKWLKAFDEYWDSECEVLIEPILKNGKRPDLLITDVSPPIAFEIVVSEKEESLVRKDETYGDIQIIPIRL